jgi:hypothetical protein
LSDCAGRQDRDFLLRPGSCLRRLRGRALRASFSDRFHAA